MLVVTEEMKPKLEAMVDKPCLWIRGEFPNFKVEVVIFKGWNSEKRMIRQGFFGKKELKTVIKEFGALAMKHVGTNTYGVFKADNYSLYRLEKGIADYESLHEQQKILNI